jgi:putative tryptophan/tyrosine transport system substrate-binding protein
MHDRTRLRSSSFRSDNRKSKSGPAGQHLKWPGLSVIAFVLVVAGAMAQAQQAKKIPQIGLLRATTPPLAAPFNQAFQQGLRELGYEEGKNVLIEYRFAEGNPARTPELVAELVRMNVDIIVAPGMNEALAAKNATTTIPIVTVVASDPVGSRLVDSLARPGGNITGLTAISAELGGNGWKSSRKLFPESLLLLFF